MFFIDENIFYKHRTLICKVTSEIEDNPMGCVGNTLNALKLMNIRIKFFNTTGNVKYDVT